MRDLHESIAEIESAIQSLKTRRCEPNDARRRIRDAIQSMAEIPQNTSLSLADTLAAVSRECAQKAKRPLAQVVIRLTSEADILPKGVYREGGRYIVRIVEEGCPDLLSKVIKDKRAQTHLKLAAAESIHDDARESLNHLTEPFTSLQELNGLRGTIMRELNYGPTKNYLSVFGFASVAAGHGERSEGR